MIPKYFYLFGEKIKVSQVNQIDRGKKFGECDFNKNIIRIAKTEINQDQRESTFHHELMHMILYHLGYEELSNDEKLVDHLGKALHQVAKTSKYE